jgi:hypothetical protein
MKQEKDKRIRTLSRLSLTSDSDISFRRWSRDGNDSMLSTLSVWRRMASKRMNTSHT